MEKINKCKEKLDIILEKINNCYTVYAFISQDKFIINLNPLQPLTYHKKELDEKNIFLDDNKIK